MKNDKLPPRLVQEAEGVGEIAANLAAATDAELGLALEWLEERKLKKTRSHLLILGEAMSRRESKDDILADYQIRAMQDAQEKLDVCQLYRLAAFGPAVARELALVLEFKPAGLPETMFSNGRAILAALRGKGKAFLVMLVPAALLAAGGLL